MSILDWFNRGKGSDNVIPFPGNDLPRGPYIPPPEREPKTFYTFGLTDDNRMTFQMGHSTLTMNREGVENLINQLEFFKNQLREDQE